eukprot:TRINITY_DN37592_c0_g1_i1.p1 TRINITY_DN37592_c0_g1~~TRINITY_DN37592_c0_g1_i1.p1  ORF type:complete len:550 (-),score=123.44 TRINITY_DN37592_c0_g1_i1:129-1778(-)
MGNAANSNLNEALNRAEKRVGKVAVTGRYHRPPKKLADDYDVSQKVLGSGYNGQVFLSKSKTNSDMYAVKGFRLHGITKEKREELVSECEIFLAMDHPHVARLVDVYESADKLDLVMECMSGGELFDRVQSRKRFNEADAAEAVNQMLLAVNYLHKHGVVHRDIKLENFLYESSSSNHLKLIDFGFSKVWSPDTRMALSCGTLSYVAPEVLKKNYTSQCDLWSLGVVTFILLVGYMPFCGDEASQIKNIETGKYLWKEAKWKTVSSTALSFVKALLVVDPEKRLTAEQALQHPFIQQRAGSKGDVPEALDQQTFDALCNFGQASAFRRACMSVMAWSLTNDERKSVRQAFLEMDSERTGVISLGEFKQVMESKFHISDEQAAKVFASLDTNHTDEIHYSEFLAAMCSTRIKLHDNLLKGTFNRFDTDNTGYISVKNLRDVLGESFEGEEVDAMLAEADLTHDGRISYDEFIQYMRDPNHEHHIDAGAQLVDAHVDATTKGSAPKTECSGPAPPGKGMMIKDAATVNPNSVDIKIDEEPPATSKCTCNVL